MSRKRPGVHRQTPHSNPSGISARTNARHASHGLGDGLFERAPLGVGRGEVVGHEHPLFDHHGLALLGAGRRRGQRKRSDSGEEPPAHRSGAMRVMARSESRAIVSGCCSRSSADVARDTERST